jgi:glycerol-3-phosphate acyltransferase PlsY
VLLGLYWPAALAFCAIWLVVAAVFRFSSLAALIASAMTPLVLWLFDLPNVAAVFTLLTLLLWIKHRENIARLLSGTEGRIGAKAESPS